MTNNLKVLAIIPARSGSKSVRDKNIRLINGMPLLGYSVKHALESSFINRTIISTDSKKYGQIAVNYGAEFPFIRPKHIAGDLSTDLEVFLHAVGWLKESEGYVPDICVHLRPTYPIRDSKDIDSMINILVNDSDLDSVRSISKSPETPFKMWFRDDSGFLKPVVNTDIKEPYNMARQSLPQTFLQNACIDVIRTSTLVQKKSMTGTNIYGYVMDNNWDIDNISQLKEVRKILSR